MGALTSILTWIYDRLKSGIAILTTTWGMVTTAVLGVGTLIGSMFSRFTFWQTFTPVLSNAQSSLNELVQSLGNGSFAWLSYMADWVGIDALAQIIIMVVSATVGVTVLIFVTVFTATFALVPTALGIRATLKAIQVTTVGYLDP